MCLYYVNGIKFIQYLSICLINIFVEEVVEKKDKIVKDVK